MTAPTAMAAPRLARPLRIAHYIDGRFTSEGANGVEQAVYHLSSAQAALGHSVAVFSRSDGTRILAGAALQPVSASEISPPRQRRRLRECVLRAHLGETLVEDVVRWRPDILHLHSVHVPANVALAARVQRVGIPYCVTVHGALSPVALRRSWLKKAAFRHLYERSYMNQAAFIHALAEHEVSDIRAYGVTRQVVIVPNGVPPDITRAPASSAAVNVLPRSVRGRRVLLFLGRLDTQQKGLDRLIEAFAAAQVPDAVLVLVGPDWRGSRARLAHLAARHRVSSQVVFTGPAFGDDKRKLLAAADVFVHPSRWEGVSLSVLSAAATGKVCLVTPAADPLGSLERNHAGIVVNGDVASMAAGIRASLALGPTERQSLGARAKCVMEMQFSWQSVAQAIVEAYHAHAVAEALAAPRGAGR